MVFKCRYCGADVTTECTCRKKVLMKSLWEPAKGRSKPLDVEQIKKEFKEYKK